MKNVEPKVYLIAHSTLKATEAERWLNDLGASRYQINHGGTDGEEIIKLAAKRCYMSFEPGLNPNVTKVREDTAAYIDNILASGHGSVLEHVTYTFAIENVSRVFTAEMNRHRAGMAISEGSLRYIRFTDIPWWIPDSLKPLEDDDEETSSRKAQTLSVFHKAFRQMEENYAKLEEIWDLTGVNANSKAFSVKKKLTSMFRRIIGMGVATGGVWTGNIRALRHIVTMRCDPAAEEEILLVATLLLNEMIKAEPILFDDFNYENGWKPKYRKV